MTNVYLIFFVIIGLLQFVLSLDSKNCKNSTNALPSKKPKMKFYLFTNDNFYKEQELFTGNVSVLKQSNFNSSLPTRILIHGWSNDWMTCQNGFIKDAYLKKGNFNVIIVDWEEWALNKDYSHVVKQIFGAIGKKLANFTKFLKKHGDISFDDMYLIGHSLGAHIAGAAGHFVQPNLFNTIYALDPAGPEFQGNAPDKRLDKSQARYVEQISTNMGVLGYTGLIGHAAFYPNYGRMQSYCILYELTNFYCSHQLSYYLFAETINGKSGFCAAKCPFDFTFSKSIVLGFGCPEKQRKRILMGGEPSVPKTGNYYLKPKDNPPFGNCKRFQCCSL